MTRLLISAKDMNLIWLLRRTGKVAAAKDAYHHFMGRFGDIGKIDFGEAFDLLKSNQLNDELSLDVLTFESSQLLRAGEVSKAILLLEKIDFKRISLGLPIWFQFQFQRALATTVSGDFAAGLEAFHICKSIAGTNLERTQCQLNVLICAESLGMIAESDFTEFERLVADVEDPTCLEDIRGQYLSLRLRFLFNKDRLREIANIPIDQICGAQSQYFFSWLSMLPWSGLSHRRQDVIKLARELGAAPDAYQGLYRMGTILGVPSPNDAKKDVRITDVASRLYLWVWNWLLDPNESQVAYLFQLSHALQSNSQRHTTRTDHFLINNALQWLALLRGVSASDVESSLGSLQVSKVSGTNRRLVLESEILRDLHIYCSPMVASFDSMPQLDSIEAKILELFSDAPSDVIALVKGRFFKELRKMLPIPNLVDGLLVSVLHGQAFNFRNGEPQAIGMSQGQIRLFCLFEGRFLVSAGEVVRNVFGVKKYDPVEHDSRLIRLLHQTNKALPASSLRFSKKGDQIQLVSKGLELHIHGYSRHTAILMRHFDELISKIEQEKSFPESDSLIKIGKILSRKDIQEILGVSKATTIRKIDDWLKTGAVKSIGKGPNTKYEVIEPEIFIV